MELLRTAVASLVFSFGALCAACAVAAQGGRWSPRLDVLTHFAPLWLAGGLVVFAFGLMSPRGHDRTLNLLAGGVAALAAGLLVAPEYLRPISRAPADAPRQLKLIHYNTLGTAAHADRTLEWILSEKPDVVVLVEASPPLTHHLQARGFHPACRDCSVTILSRDRPIARDVPKVDSARRARAPTARATFADKDGGYTVVGTHYVWPTYGDMQQRQGERLALVLDKLPKERLILAGDFNSTPWSFTRRREDRRFGLERRTKALFTWPTGEGPHRSRRLPWPILPIDHVYAGSDWKTVEVRRGPRLGSDHFPVVVTLALDPED